MPIILAISGLYFVTRLIALTSLPVFADEAIYIRWAQLLNQDQAYLFFSINDGKPPLFIWLTALALNFGTNPLWQARLVSVMIGWLQLIVSDRILKILGGSEVARLIQAMLIILLPFWFLNGAIILNGADFTISYRGEIIQNGETVDTLRVRKFENPESLRK